jgi:hypothetical protein
MPVQYPNFGNIPLVEPDYSGIVNFIPQALKSYKETAEARETPFELRHKRMMNEEKLKAAAMENALEQLYGKKTREAEIASKLAYAQNLLNPQTSTQRDLAAIYGAGTPEFKEALKENYELQGLNPSNELYAKAIDSDIPPDVLGGSLRGLPKNEQLFYVKKMEDDLKKAQNMTKTIKTLDQMQSIMDQNPNLWKSFSLMLSNPEDKSGLEEYVKRNIINKDEKTQVDIFRKLSNELVASGGEALGSGQRFTDARQALIASMKPDVANTAEANKFIIKNMKGLMGAGPEWEKALRFGLKNRYKIIDNPQLFRESAERGQPELLGGFQGADVISRGAQDMVQIRSNKTGEVKFVTKEEAERLRGGQ